MLLAKDKTASGHLMHGAHACLVPVNYATTNVFKQLEEKQKAARKTRFLRLSPSAAAVAIYFINFFPSGGG